MIDNKTLTEINELLQKRHVTKAMFTLKVFLAQHLDMKQLKINFDINDIAKVCHLFNEEDVKAKKSSLQAYRDRLTVLVKLIISNDYFVGELESDSLLRILLNARYEDSCELIKYITSKDLNILNNHRKAFDSIYLLKNYKFTYNADVIDDLEVKVNNEISKIYFGHLYNLLKEIKISIKSDEPVEFIKQPEIISKLLLGYILCLNIAISSPLFIYDTEEAEEKIKKGVRPYLGVIMYLMNKSTSNVNSNPTLLSQKTLLSYYENYRCGEPLAYAVMLQLYQLAACFANYQNFDLDFVKTVSSFTSCNNEAFHLFTIKTNKKEVQYAAPLKRNPTACFSLLAEKNQDYSIQGPMLNTYHSTIANLYLINCTMTGMKFNCWKELKYDEINDLDEKYTQITVDDSLEALMALQTIYKHSVTIYKQSSQPSDLLKLAPIKVALDDPAFFYLFHHVIGNIVDLITSL